MVEIALPQAFRNDRISRGLPVGAFVREYCGKAVVLITPEELAEYFNDAEFYSDKYGPDASIGLKASARASVKAILAAFPGIRSTAIKEPAWN